jgi:hypothetical protein
MIANWGMISAYANGLTNRYTYQMAGFRNASKKTWRWKMKNNCDVSGEWPECQEWSDCDYKKGACHIQPWNRCYCTNLAAIRAAIEAENHIADSGKKVGE